MASDFAMALVIAAGQNSPAKFKLFPETAE
jgi:hypothetical protein